MRPVTMGVLTRRHLAIELLDRVRCPWWAAGRAPLDGGLPQPHVRLIAATGAPASPYCRLLSDIFGEPTSGKGAQASSAHKSRTRARLTSTDVGTPSAEMLTVTGPVVASAVAPIPGKP